MASYNYQCLDCGATEPRLAGPDDHLAICSARGGLLLDREEEVFAPLFEDQRLLARARKVFRAGLAAAREKLASAERPTCEGEPLR